MALRNAVEVTAREIAREELRDQIGELRTVVSASKGAQAPEIQHLQRTIREAYEEAERLEALEKRLARLERIRDAEVDGQRHEAWATAAEREAKGVGAKEPVTRPRDTLTKEEPGTPESALDYLHGMRRQTVKAHGGDPDDCKRDVSGMLLREIVDRLRVTTRHPDASRFVYMDLDKADFDNMSAREVFEEAQKQASDPPGTPEPELPEPDALFATGAGAGQPWWSESTVRSLIERAKKAERERDYWKLNFDSELLGNRTQRNKMQPLIDGGERLTMFELVDAVVERIRELEAERDAYADPGNWKAEAETDRGEGVIGYTCRYIGPTPSDSTEVGEAESVEGSGGGPWGITDEDSAAIMDRYVSDSGNELIVPRSLMEFTRDHLRARVEEHYRALREQNGKLVEENERLRTPSEAERWKIAAAVEADMDATLAEEES